jgi:large subunit ribosomal protein L19
MEKSTAKQPHSFNVGDKVVVNYKIKEGEKFRTQPFEGLVIAIKGAGMSKTFTVRRIGVASIGIERIFPMYSPNIDSVEVKAQGKVRRSKLYYLRDRIGKAATKIKTRAKVVEPKVKATAEVEAEA